MQSSCRPMRHSNTLACRILACVLLIVALFHGTPLAMEELDLEWTVATGLQGGAPQALASLGDRRFSVDEFGVLRRSTDDGSTWTVVEGSLDFGFLTGMTSCGEELVVYGFEGIHTSLDSGETWEARSGNFPHIAMEFPGHENFFVISHLACNEDSVFVALFFDSLVVVSTDGGRNWQTVRDRPFEWTIDVVVLDSHILVSTDDSLHLSHDQGRSWTSRSVATSTTPRFMSWKGRILRVAGGLDYSEDGGENWSPWLESEVRHCATSSSRIVCLGRGSLHVTQDHGSQWEHMELPAPFTLVRYEQDGNQISLGDETLLATDFEDLMRMDIESGALEILEQGLGAPFVRQFLRIPESDTLLAIAGDHIYHSDDNGGTWSRNSRLPEGDCNLLVLGSNWICALDEELHHKPSPDQEWKQVASDYVSIHRGWPFSGKLDYLGGDVMAYGLGSRTLISSDSGMTWRPAPLHWPESISKLWKNDSLWLMAANSGIYHSKDEGQSWLPANEGLPADPTCLIDEGNATPNPVIFGFHQVGVDIYAGSFCGLYALEDGQLPWVDRTPEEAKWNYQGEWHLPPMEIIAESPAGLLVSSWMHTFLLDATGSWRYFNDAFSLARDHLIVDDRLLISGYGIRYAEWDSDASMQARETTATQLSQRAFPIGGGRYLVTGVQAEGIRQAKALDARGRLLQAKVSESSASTRAVLVELPHASRLARYLLLETAKGSHVIPL